MSRRKTANSRIIHTAACCALCLAAQGLLYSHLEKSGARLVSPVHNENTLIRMQRLPMAKGEVLLMGSSITERMLPDGDIAVVAVPGSSFTAGCILMEEANLRFPPGTVYAIEVNNLFSGNNGDILNKTRESQFRITRFSSHFSIAARPVNLLSSTIFSLTSSGKDGRREQACFDAPPIQPEPTGKDSPGERDLAEWSQVIHYLNLLREQGGKLCFVNYPSRDLKGFEDRLDKARRLSNYMDIPILDYNSREWAERLVFTDHHHQKSNAVQTAMFRNTIARDARKYAK